MAMTKKERSEFDAAIRKSELMAALRWTAPIRPDVAPPEPGLSGFTEGWTYNVHSRSVGRAWSTSIGHGYGPITSHVSQEPIWLFSVRELAYAAMRHEFELQSAKTLLEIDKEMEKTQCPARP